MSSKRFNSINNVLLQFNLLNSTDPIVIPVIANLFGGNTSIKTIVNRDTGEITIIQLDKDGKTDPKMPSVILKGDKLSIISNEKKVDFNMKTDEKVVNPVSDVDNKNLQQTVDAKLPSITSMLGTWKFSGLGQEIVLSISPEADNKFSSSATILGKKYSGIGSSSSSSPSVGYDLSANFEKENLGIKIKQTKSDSISVTLTSVPPESKLSTYLNLPLNLTLIGSLPAPKPTGETSKSNNDNIGSIINLKNNEPVVGGASNNKILNVLSLENTFKLEESKYDKNSVEFMVSNLFKITFGKTADEDNLNYWFDLYTATNNDLKYMAKYFTSAGEFEPIKNLSDKDFVNNLYKNAFGRAGDEQGISYWVDVLKNGATRADLIVTFLEIGLGQKPTIDTQSIGQLGIISGSI